MLSAVQHSSVNTLSHTLNFPSHTIDQMQQIWGSPEGLVEKSPKNCHPIRRHPRTFPGHLPLMSRILPEGSAANFACLPNFEASLCTHCGLCANNCPMNAIDIKTLSIDESKCLRCFACVRICPRNARSIKLKHTWLVKRVLKKAATYRQEPSIFL